MARDTFEEWITDEKASEVLHREGQGSAVEQLADPTTMVANVKTIPRDGGFTVGNVPKATAYGESTSTDDTVDLIARKCGGIEKIAEEDLFDPYVDVLASKRVEAVRALSINFDNSCLAVTGAMNGTTIKYNSVYKELNTNGSGVAGSYVAGDQLDSITRANFVATLSASSGYDAMNTVFGYIEEGDYFDEANTVVIASPLFRKLLRGVKDADGNPMLVPRAGSGLARPQYDIFGYQTFWTMGARTSAVDSQQPTGNGLLIVANRRLLKRGVTSLNPQIPSTGVGFALQRSANGAGFDDDTAKMKAAFRRAFRMLTPYGASCLEVTP